MKGGKTEIEEPPTITSYTFSPRGREILTIGNKMLEKESKGRRDYYRLCSVENIKSY